MNISDQPTGVANGESRLKYAGLTSRTLLNATWSFGTVSGQIYGQYVKLMPNHRIGGYHHPNETFWELRDGYLRFKNQAGEVTTIFDVCESAASGQIMLSGYQVAFPAETARHLLRETKEPRHIAGDASQFKIDKHGAAPKRRNLVIMGVNQKSLHHQWVRNLSDEDRNWDLALSFYGDAEHYPPLGPAEYTSLQPGVRKWTAIHAAMYEGSPFWDYERIMVMDDDILTSWRDLNYFLEICRDYDLGLAQPSLRRDCCVTHPITAQRPNSLMRFTNFIEAMAPCFTAEALRICIPCTQASIYGFGIDHIWPHLLRLPFHRMAIIDAVAINHTRPLATAYSLSYAKAEEAKLLQQYGVKGSLADIRETGQIFLQPPAANL